MHGLIPSLRSVAAGTSPTGDATPSAQEMLRADQFSLSLEAHGCVVRVGFSCGTDTVLLSFGENEKTSKTPEGRSATFWGLGFSFFFFVEFFFFRFSSQFF